MHTKPLQTHEDTELSFCPVGLPQCQAGGKKNLRTPTATERMRAYSLNYSSSSLKSVLCAQILMLAPFPADKQLSTPHSSTPYAGSCLHPRFVPTFSMLLYPEYIPCTILDSFCRLLVFWISQPFSLLTSIRLHHQL